ncbi:MAG TPA: hypothetical protein VF828_03395 [Patescibacteria group bacterium]
MKKAYTLVELIMAVTIMMIVGVGALMAISTFNNGEKLKAASDDMAESVRLAKNYAVTSQLPAGFAAGVSMKYTLITYNAATFTAQISAVGDDGTTVPYPYAGKIIDKDVAVAMHNPNDNLMYFAAGTGKLEAFNGSKVDFIGTGTTASVSLNYQSTNKYLIVNSMGQVNVK